MKELKILIIEDDEELLGSYGEYASQVFPAVEAAKNLEQAAKLLSREKYDCILLDNRLPDGQGISFIKNEPEISAQKIPIVMITAYADKNLVIDSVNAGIFYFLEKPVSRQRLLETLQKCFRLSMRQNKFREMENLYFISQKTASYLKEHRNISEREIEIISCVMLNDRNTDIAEKLFISSGTVKRHIHNIFEKLKIPSREKLQKLIHGLNRELE